MAKRFVTKYIVVHSSATRPSMQDIGVDTIRGWHRARGFKDVGYHFIIKRDGAIEQGRELYEIGAHVKGFNDKSVGICMVGGVEDKNPKVAENNFTVFQWASLLELLAKLTKEFPDAQVVGHKDLAATECPSFNVKEWCKEYEELRN